VISSFSISLFESLPFYQKLIKIGRFNFMQRKISAIFLAVLLIMSVIGCSQSTSNQNTQENKNNSQTNQESTKQQTKQETKEEKKDPIVLKLGHGTATNSLYHAGAEKFKELAEAQSNGQIKVELFPDGKLGHDRDLTEGMKLGTIQMGMIGVEPLTTIAPKLKAINLPFLFTDRDSAYKVLDGDLGAEMVADLPEKQGVRVLGFFENGFRNVTNSKKEVLTPADLQGLKIRTPQSPVSLSIFKALGANPTPMSFGELYTALEQGTVDGQENPLSLIHSAKFYEVQKFVSLTGHIYSPMVLTISEKAWSELSPELQKVVQAAADEAKAYERKLSADQEADLIAKLEAEGVKISRPDVSLFKEATKDVHLEFDAEYGAEFYQKILDSTSK
jgi:tripartite ATP-independent transporter DctP family solute receptor